jgi:ribonuclease P protein component
VSSPIWLKKRHEFLKVQNGRKLHSPYFLFCVFIRSTETTNHITGLRFGLTITKKQGNAVERNRIRRRLKAVVQDFIKSHNSPAIPLDIVMIAKRGVLSADFERLKADFILNWKRVVKHEHTSPL